MEKMLKMIVSILGVIAGVAIIILGVNVTTGGFAEHVSTEVNSKLISTTSMNQSPCSFGADFYTEIYGATYDADNNIVELGNTNANAANQISKNQGAMINAIDISQKNMMQTVGLCVIVAGGIVLLAFLYLLVCAITLVPKSHSSKPSVSVPMVSSQDE